METDVTPEPARYVPCDICGDPAKVTSRFTEWAAHWSCALLGKKRIEELRRADSASAGFCRYCGKSPCQCSGATVSEKP